MPKHKSSTEPSLNMVINAQTKQIDQIERLKRRGRKTT